MDIEDVRRAVHKEPFEPFTMRLSDGRSMPVGHPDFVALSPSVVVVIAADDGSWSSIDPFMIVSLDYQRQKRKKSGV